eukprot:1159844-Pelagomonas_calceolata.AAC.2
MEELIRWTTILEVIKQGKMGGEGSDGCTFAGLDNSPAKWVLHAPIIGVCIFALELNSPCFRAPCQISRSMNPTFFTKSLFPNTHCTKWDVSISNGGYINMFWGVKTRPRVELWAIFWLTEARTMIWGPLTFILFR